MQDPIIQSFPNLRTCTLGIVNSHGAAHDIIPGSTQVLMQTLPRGSSNFDELQIANLIDGTGGSLFSATEKTFSVVGTRIQRKKFHKSLDLLLDMLKSPNLEPKHIEIEKNNLIQIYNQIIDHPLRKILLLEADKAIFGQNHPFGKMVIGDPTSLKKVDTLVVAKTHRKLIKDPFGILVGNFSKKMEQRISTSFNEKILDLEKSKGSTLPISRPKLTQGNINTSVNRNDGNVYICINVTTDVSKDRIGLARFSSSLLGESFGSRMFAELRDKRGLGYIVGSSMNLVDKYLTIRCYMETSPNRAIEALGALFEIIFDLSNNEITPTEYHTTKEFILGSLDLTYDNSQMIANRILYRQIHGLSPNLDDSYTEIREVTPKGLNQFWGNIKETGNLSCAVVGNFDEVDVTDKWNSLVDNL